MPHSLMRGNPPIRTITQGFFPLFTDFPAYGSFFPIFLINCILAETQDQPETVNVATKPPYE